MAHAIPIWMLLKTVQCCCLLWSQVRIRPHIAIAGSWAQVDMVERNNQSFNSLITTRFFFFVFCLYHGAHIRLQVGSMGGWGKCGWGCGKTKSDSFCFIIIHWSLLGVWFDAVASILSFYPFTRNKLLGWRGEANWKKKKKLLYVLRIPSSCSMDDGDGLRGLWLWWSSLLTKCPILSSLSVV